MADAEVVPFSLAFNETISMTAHLGWRCPRRLASTLPPGHRRQVNEDVYAGKAEGKFLSLIC